MLPRFVSFPPLANRAGQDPLYFRGAALLFTIMSGLLTHTKETSLSLSISLFIHRDSVASAFRRPAPKFVFHRYANPKSSSCEVCFSLVPRVAGYQTAMSQSISLTESQKPNDSSLLLSVLRGRRRRHESRADHFRTTELVAAVVGFIVCPREQIVRLHICQ